MVEDPKLPPPSPSLGGEGQKGNSVNFQPGKGSKMLEEDMVVVESWRSHRQWFVVTISPP